VVAVGRDQYESFARTVLFDAATSHGGRPSGGHLWRRTRRSRRVQCMCSYFEAQTWPVSCSWLLV
jgi:hypothetical protein